jgi:aspartate/methionine/tyrosine aminotransferase
MAGWRIGMLCGKSEVIEQTLKVKSNMDSGMFFGIQKGAIEALKMKPNWFKSLNQIYYKRKRLMENLVVKLGATIEHESVGLFIWAKLPKGAPKSEVFIDNLLIKKNIFITPGTIFGSQGEGYIRLSLCVSETLIKQAIERMKS